MIKINHRITKNHVASYMWLAGCGLDHLAYFITITLSDVPNLKLNLTTLPFLV